MADLPQKFLLFFYKNVKKCLAVHEYTLYMCVCNMHIYYTFNECIKNEFHVADDRKISCNASIKYLSSFLCILIQETFKKKKKLFF